MAAFTISNTPFPEGTTVGVYKAEGYGSAPATPPGTAVTTAAVTGGIVTFSGLTDHVPYFAFASVGGVWQSIRFMPGENGPPPRFPDDADFATLGPNKVLSTNAAATGYEFVDVGTQTELDAVLQTAEDYTDSQVAARTGTFPLFDAKLPAFGGKANGTDDDRPSIAAAIAATGGAGTAYLSEGEWLLDSTAKSGSYELALSLPADAAGLTVKGAGRGATILKLTANCPRAFDVWPESVDQSFQNLTLEDFTVDANDIATSLSCHTLLGNIIDAVYGAMGTASGRASFKNITVRRVNVISAHVETGAQGRQIVSLLSHHLGAGETASTLDNILFEDCDLGGGNSGIVVAANGHVDANCTYDRVRYVRCKHDPGSAPTATHADSNFQIGSYAKGNYAAIIDCEGANSADVGVEVDNATTFICDGTEITDSFNAEFLVRNFSAPLNLAAQRAIFRKTRARVVNLTPTYTGGASAVGYLLSQSGDPAFGEVIFDDASFYSASKELTAGGQAIKGGQTCARITSDDFSATLDSVADVSSGARFPTLILLTPEVDSIVKLKNTRISIAGSTTNASLVPRYIKLQGGKSANIVYEIDGVDIDSNLTGVGAGNTSLVHNCDGAYSVQGSIKRVRVLSFSGDTAPLGLRFEGKTQGTTIDGRILLGENDFRKLPGGATAVSLGASGGSFASQIYYGGDMEPGELAPTPLVGNNGTLAVANRLYLARFVPTRDFIATAIGWSVVVGATNDDACDVGIYDATGTTKLASAGATTGKMNSAGAKSISIAGTPVYAGTVYYIGLSYGAVGGTAATLSMDSHGSGGLTSVFGAALPYYIHGFQATAHPLPSSFTINPAITNVPILAVLE